jgi:hypothetical protein
MQIRAYKMDNIILDLGLDVNVIPRHTWEMISKSKMIWSLIQLRLANQHKIILVGRLIGFNVNIDGVHSVAYFEANEIVDGSHTISNIVGTGLGI